MALEGLITCAFSVPNYTNERTAAPPAATNDELRSVETYTHERAIVPPLPPKRKRRPNGSAKKTTPGKGTPAQQANALAGPIDQTPSGNPYPVVVQPRNNIDSPNPDVTPSSTDAILTMARPASASNASPDGASSVAATPVPSYEDRQKRKRRLSESNGYNGYEEAKKARQVETRGEAWEVVATEELFLHSYAPWLCDEPLNPDATTQSNYENTLAVHLPAAAPQLDENWSSSPESCYSQDDIFYWSLDESLEEGRQVEVEGQDGEVEPLYLPSENSVDAAIRAYMDAIEATNSLSTAARALDEEVLWFPHEWFHL